MMIVILFLEQLMKFWRLNFHKMRVRILPKHASSFFYSLPLVLVSFLAVAQCDVTITPQGPTTFCAGDSVILIASGNGGAVALDQSQNFYNGGTSARNLPGYSYWQSFQAGMTGTLVEIEAGFFTYINGTGYWTVWEGSGTGGVMLDSQALTIYCSGGNCLIAFEENIPVTAGNTYTFQIRGGPGMPDPYGLQIGAGNPYVNGEMGFVDPSGTYLTEFDWVFKTYVESEGVTYLWSNGETDSAIAVTEDGEYMVMATGTAGCMDSAEVEVTVHPLPEVSIGVKADTICFSDATVLLLGDPPGGVFTGQGVNADHFVPPSTGVFTVYYSYADGFGCTNTDSLNLVVEVCTGSAVDKDVVFECRQQGEQLLLRINSLREGTQFHLFNGNGENVLRTNMISGLNSIDIGHLPAGIYFYHIYSGAQSFRTGKIFIGR